jgi:hypothetical protein
MILVFKNLKSGVTTEYKREIFDRGLFGADPKLVAGEVSPSSERREMMEEGRNSRYSFQGGSALGAELELFEIVPPSRIRPPLIYRGRSGYMTVWGSLAYSLHTSESRRVL